MEIGNSLYFLPLLILGSSMFVKGGGAREGVILVSKRGNLML